MSKEQLRAIDIMMISLHLINNIYYREIVLKKEMTNDGEQFLLLSENVFHDIDKHKN